MRNTKRFGALAIAAALVLAACGDDNDEGSGSEGTTPEGGTTAQCVEQGDVKLGIAFDTGGRGDGTFNDSAAAGADKAECELGVGLDELEATTADDRGPNLETLTSNGNNPIVAVGFAFGDALAGVAAANPDTSYAIVDGFIPDAPANITFLGFAEEQGSFLVGAAAALKSESGVIGFIGGQEIDLIKKFEAGYTAGAKAVNPDIEVKVQYLGAAGDNAAWASPDKAKEIALGWYGEGADIIYTAAGGSGAGTIDAAVEAGDGKWAIGVDSDQYLTASPEQQAHILTSMLKRVDVAVYQTADKFLKGELKGGFETFDLAVDGVGYSTSGGFVDDIVPQLEDFKAQIIAGDIVVPTAP